MTIRRALRVLLALAVALLVLPGVAGGPGLSAAQAGTVRWAPAATATIHPGVMTNTPVGQCTANFVFTSGATVLIGQAAHCAGTGDSTQTDGCTSPSLPLGTKVQVDGATKPGVLVYSSWLAMQRRHERNADACAYNDLALVRIDPADVRRVNPSVPFFGGPTGLRLSSLHPRETVLSYGNSSLRFGVSVLSPKRGVTLGSTSYGWSHPVYTASPGIPGDSGSGFLDVAGRATGVLSTLSLLPLPVSNGVGDLAHELAYLNRYGGFRATVATGTEPFRNRTF